MVGLRGSSVSTDQPARSGFSRGGRERGGGRRGGGRTRDAGTRCKLAGDGGACILLRLLRCVKLRYEMMCESLLSVFDPGGRPCEVIVVDWIVFLFLFLFKETYLGMPCKRFDSVGLECFQGPVMLSYPTLWT